MRKHSLGGSLLSEVVPSPEDIAKETKRLKMRFKIINEIVQTEQTFLQDMTALQHCYAEYCQECPLITSRHKQTIFGRLKNVLSFTETFQKELSSAGAEYVRNTEERLVEIKYEDLALWDSETYMGEAFWSSVRLILAKTNCRWYGLRRRILDTVHIKRKLHRLCRNWRRRSR